MDTEAYNVLSLLLQFFGFAATVGSLLFIWGQLKEMKKATDVAVEEAQATTKATQFGVLQRIEELMKSIDSNLYDIPEEILYRADEFPDNPPPRHKVWNLTAGEADIIERAKKKRAEYFKDYGGYEQFDKAATNAINALNSVTHYIENGYINNAHVLGIYHFKILRIIHIVEGFRNFHVGDGDYGHSLLRLRQMAVDYHNTHPKHRDKEVWISLHKEGKEINVKLYERNPQTGNAESGGGF